VIAELLVVIMVKRYCKDFYDYHVLYNLTGYIMLADNCCTETIQIVLIESAVVIIVVIIIIIGVVFIARRWCTR